MPKAVSKQFFAGIEDEFRPRLSGRRLVVMQKAYFATQAHVQEGMDFADFTDQIRELMENNELCAFADAGDGARTLSINQPSETRKFLPHAILGVLYMHIWDHKDVKVAIYDDGTNTTMITQKGDITHHPTPKRSAPLQIRGNGAGHARNRDENFQQV